MVAGHDRMKGSANAAWNGVVKPSGPTKKYGDRVKNRRGGAPGGCACRSHGAQHRKVQMKTIAPFGAPLPHAGEGRKKRAVPKARLRAWAALWPTKQQGR